MSSGRFREEYPLHWFIWQNDFSELQKALDSNVHDIEKFDCRGRTPLLLSVTLGRLECTRVLLKANANVNVETKDGFSVLHEAISTGDPELIQEILERRDYQRYSSRVGGIPELLKRIRDTPDFYVEMKWEFTSWVPLVSRMCPSDTYKVYKSGSNVRIDTTLLGFDQSNWQRGSRSYVFKGQDSATMMEIDHESGQVYVEQMRVLSPQLDDMHAFRPTSESVSARLTTPIVTTFVDTDKINFERNKSGIWGWRSDRSEVVNGHESKVFSANNVELVTKTRTEHLTEADKIRHKTSRSPLQSLLGIVEVEEKNPSAVVNGESKNSTVNPCHITPEEYFNPEVDLGGRDIGRPREISTKVQKFKANLWLCENYPLSLPEQILPIVDLMAISSTHFAKLRDFITLQLPAGFPVKIEIPLFHVLNARITFGNIFALDEAVPGVTPIEEEKAVACVLDDNCFDVPSGYVRLGSDSLRPLSIDEDDELLQYAIQQSLMEAGSEEDQVTIWEALRAQKPNSNGSEDEDLQKAIQESLSETPAAPKVVASPMDDFRTSEETQLEIALKLSQQAREDEEKQLQEEQEVLERVLRLSLAEQ
ncbi:ankyrin repeat domain-containing protein 13D-like isoform X2 [Uloborus diversus]|uniref:ankyrin repeat domain-containing protein 13D-like isoform X2 n=1 Tax=Uloborus diversus TaxID=327109 RepID=UPI002409D061|nr:ankyrin repeat domain-containing protein 13D-like isoform X2 [Uloborus diversus]